MNSKTIQYTSPENIKKEFFFSKLRPNSVPEGLTWYPVNDCMHAMQIGFQQVFVLCYYKLLKSFVLSVQTLVIITSYKCF